LKPTKGTKISAIEKVCEFLGEHSSTEMPRYKRNHIQVMPKFRKEFRGKDHVLHIFKPEVRIQTKCKSIIWIMGENYFHPYDENDYQTYQAYVQGELDCWRGRLVHEYEFALEVPDLPGEVGGIYMNWTYNLRQTIKRLKRMLRCREVIIKKHNCSYWEWRQSK
jgi:hypothetical protein